MCVKHSSRRCAFGRQLYARAKAFSRIFAPHQTHVHKLSLCMPAAVILASAHARDARGRGPVMMIFCTFAHVHAHAMWANRRNGADGRSPGQDLRQQSAQDVQDSQGRGATSVPMSCTHICVASARCTCGAACFIPMQHRTVFSAASKGEAPSNQSKPLSARTCRGRKHKCSCKLIICDNDFVRVRRVVYVFNFL